MIAYSHVNEDSDPEWEELNRSGKKRCVVVAGSGERVISLLDSDCKEFVILDLNKAALYLTELKLVAIQYVDAKDYLGFVGADNSMESEERISIYKSIKGNLNPNTAHFFDNNLNQIKDGILFSGEFEKFLGRVRPLLRFVLGEKFIDKITEGTYKLSLFERFRWKLVNLSFKLKMTYTLFGNKDQAFVGSGAKVNEIAKVLDRQFKNRTAHKSFMVHLIFRGDLVKMKDEHLPRSMSAKVLESIKTKLAQDDVLVSLKEVDLKEYLQKNILEETFISCSDILSFVKSNYVFDMLRVISGRGNQVVLRAFIRNRLSSADLKEIDGFRFNISEVTSVEKTGMYQVLTLG